MTSAAPPASLRAGGLRLRVTHLTRFLYHGEVLESHNEARLCPVSDPLQRCASFSLTIRPSVTVITREDFFCNRVDYFDVMAPHDSLEIRSDAVVETRAEMRGEPPRELGLHSLDDPDTDVSVFDFQVASQLIETPVLAANEARKVIGPEVTGIWEDAVSLARHVHSILDYVPGATDSRTPVAEVLERRRGVCQDFANLTIALCRSRGIPARYVSGYFYNGRTEEHEIEASHAWFEVYVPGYGWKGWDPTHDRPADPRYIKLAVGRDYADVRPVGGRFLGRGTQEMVVEVRVRHEPGSEQPED
jgi:transglutaminase-like putative cysteine protease